MKYAPFRRIFDSTIGCVALLEGEKGAIVVVAENAFLKTNMNRGKMEDFGKGADILVERPEQSSSTRPVSLYEMFFLEFISNY